MNTKTTLMPSITESFTKVKELFPDQDKLIAATYVRTGLLPMKSFEKGKLVSETDVGFVAFDVSTQTNPPMFISFKREEMLELAKRYEPNDKLLEVISNVKEPSVVTKPVKAKSANGCAYSKPQLC